MSLQVKALLAGTAVVGVGGSGIWIMYNPRRPDWEPISDFSSYSSKYAGKYHKYLVGVEDGKNVDWWKWSYNNQYRTPSSAGFKGASIKDGNTLKEACKKAYGGSATSADGNVTVTGENSTTTNYSEEEIWSFCSIGRGKPKTLSEAKSDGDANKEEKDKLETGDWKEKVGGKNESKLLSIAYEGNEWIWELKQKEFTGESTNTETDTNKFFARPTSSAPANIIDKCRDAYGKDEITADESADKPLKTDVLKWCSLEIGSGDS